MAELTATGLSPGEAWVFSGMLAGKSVDLEGAELRPRWKSLAQRLVVYPMIMRSIGWKVLTADLPDRDAVVAAVAKADPHGPRPDDAASADDGVIAFKIHRPDPAQERTPGAGTEAGHGDEGEDGDDPRYVLTAAGRRRLDQVDEPPWPAEIGPAALQGMAGEVVGIIEPNTEADPAAVLVQFLVAFGNLIGDGPTVHVDGHDHHANLFAVVVGDTSRARKGTSWRRVREVLSACDPDWAAGRVLGGLSSGEGLIWAVRDPIKGPDKRTGDEVVLDRGIDDKRLLVVENEFGGALRVLGREGSTLSAILRQAYDGGDLQFLTKSNPAASTSPHVSLCGHVTREELAKHLSSVEAFNGLGNRILWACARRSKLLPFGGDADAGAMTALARRLAVVADDARAAGALRWTSTGRARWADAYDVLTESRPGLLGAVTSRAEAHTLRLSMIYALLDRSPEIADVHVEAAAAVWRYCADSAAFLFGRFGKESKLDAQADQVLAALKQHHQGLSRSTISLKVLNSKMTAADITRILDSLVKAGQASRRTVVTGGRSSEWYFAL